jgi:hypothetical protein
VKVSVLVAMPPGVVRLILPVEPPPTTASISVLELTANEAADVPPKLTPVAPLRLVPVIVTVSPVLAEAGVKEVIAGMAV